MTTKNNQTQHYIHQKHKREIEKKTALANKTIYTLIWYAFDDLWSGNGVGPILTAPEPTRGMLRSNIRTLRMLAELYQWVITQLELYSRVMYNSVLAKGSGLLLRK